MQCGTLTLILVAAAFGHPASAQPTPLDPAPETQPADTEPAPAAPVVTRALLPGHWQLKGAGYVWVPPETTLRLVQTRPLVPGQNVWMGGRWIYVPSHYADVGENQEP